MQTKPNFTQAALGGFAGTLVMTAMMYLVAPMLGVKMDIAGMLGSMLGGSWAAGLMMHVVNGAVIFPALYTFVVYDRLPGSALVKGLTFGVALWLVQQTMVIPMMGAGILSRAMGGMMAAMGALVGHLLYGATLGVVASAQEQRAVTA